MWPKSIPNTWRKPPNWFERVEKEARQIAEDAKGKIEKAGLQGKAIARTLAQPAEAILEIAREKEIDLIVMGTRGRSRIKRLILGSVAQRVVGQAPCPVMVVPG